MEIVVEAQDRQGLLRDISEVLSKERLNVIAVNTVSKAGSARMKFHRRGHRCAAVAAGDRHGLPSRRRRSGKAG